MVRHELVHVLFGLTLNGTFTFSRTISALGLVASNIQVIHFMTFYGVHLVCDRHEKLFIGTFNGPFLTKLKKLRNYKK